MDENDVIVTDDGTVIVKGKLGFPGPYIYYFPEDRENCRKEDILRAYLNVNSFLPKYMDESLKDYKKGKYEKISDSNKVEVCELKDNIWFERDGQEFFLLKGDYLLKDLKTGEIYGCSKKDFESTFKKSNRLLFSIDFLLTKYNELMNK